MTAPLSRQMKRDQRPVLAEWTIWFLVMAGSVGLILFALFGGERLLGGVTAEHLMYVAIGGLAVFTLYRNFADVRLIDSETRLASKQVEELDELNDIEGFLEHAEPSIFRDHIGALYKIFRSDHEIRQEALVSLLLEKMLARNRVTELLAGILTTLGLIGTVIGLILVMGSMQEDLANFDPSDPSANIIQTLMRDGGALSGLDAAFYTTLFGALSGGVLLRVLSHFVEASIVQYAARIAELTEINVLPQMRSLARELERSGYYARQNAEL
jgi:hypothetical protein